MGPGTPDFDEGHRQWSARLVRLVNRHVRNVDNSVGWKIRSRGMTLWDDATSPRHCSILAWPIAVQRRYDNRRRRPATYRQSLPRTFRLRSRPSHRTPAAVRRRIRDDVEYFGGRGLLLQRLVQLTCEKRNLPRHLGGGRLATRATLAALRGVDVFRRCGFTSLLLASRAVSLPSPGSGEGIVSAQFGLWEMPGFEFQNQAR